ncbi:hypothetical protein AERO8C_160293 [Aeromonas veronii]|uniref:Uncharacterized protein n=1 Tax=Aeromonas veronii TaxID=654 RepID=A0A653KY41_AERVE|nr:hypothetical protein AERO8C_160293 [Aeromonas veronii]
MIINLVHADQVIILALFDGSVFVFADINADDSLIFGLFYLGHQMIHPLVVESHPVDDPLCRNNPEQARLVIAALGSGGDGTDFDKTKSHGAQRVNALTIFIQTGRQSHRIGKRKPHDSDGAFRQILAEETIEWRTEKAGQIFHGEIVSLFRIEFEQEMPGDGVQHLCSLKKAPATGRGFGCNVGVMP